MNTYFLDTSVIIDYLRGKDDVVRSLDNFSGSLVSCLVVKAELYEGVYLSNNKDKTGPKLEDFFAGLTEVYGMNTAVAKKFGEIRSDLRSRGKLIDDMDILIAATCLVNKLPVVTSNPKHFNLVKDLVVIAPTEIEN
jgi:predicted nucleic acid-binding protein